MFKQKANVAMFIAVVISLLILSARIYCYIYPPYFTKYLDLRFAKEAVISNGENSITINDNEKLQRMKGLLSEFYYYNPEKDTDEYSGVHFRIDFIGDGKTISLVPNGDASFLIDKTIYAISGVCGKCDSELRLYCERELESFSKGDGRE